MNRSEAVAIISRRLNLNAGRVAALAQRAAEGGALPKASGRSIPDLGPLELARLLLCAVADRGLGAAPRSVTAFSDLRADNGAVLIDVVEGWIHGAVPVSGVRSAIFQTAPEPAATIISGAAHIHFGQERSRDAAARTVVIPGDSLAAIVLEFRGYGPREADEAIAVAKLRAALN